jgi:hypothetical protein
MRCEELNVRHNFGVSPNNEKNKLTIGFERASEKSIANILDFNKKFFFASQIYFKMSKNSRLTD